MSKNGRELDIIMLGNGRIVSYDSEFIFEHSNYANTVRLISPDIGLGYTVELNMVRADGIEGVPLGMSYIGAADAAIKKREVSIFFTGRERCIAAPLFFGLVVLFIKIAFYCELALARNVNRM